jgi:tRNA(Ile)-lysidine synthase
MCLLHYLDTWGRRRGFSVGAAHFNHRLRPAADRDEEFVRDWCAGRGIPFFAGSGDVRSLAEEQGLTLEEGGRKLRYDFLRETAEREGFSAVLTAHHTADNAETMLLNLIRGTGPRASAASRRSGASSCGPSWTWGVRSWRPTPPLTASPMWRTRPTPTRTPPPGTCCG